MADSNISGPFYGNRQGSVGGAYSWKISGTASTSTVALPGIVQASADTPVVLEAQLLVATADGGTTPTASLGTTSGNANELINAASTATAAATGTFLPASNAVGKVVVTADTTLYFKQGGTPNGAGVYYWIIRAYELNTLPLS